ncbi:hypothetical protein ACROYT_G025639 [Oculina patagonica]
MPQNDGEAPMVALPERDPKEKEGLSPRMGEEETAGKAAFDKRATPLSKLQVGEPIRLQPTNPKTPLEKGTCVAKVSPRSCLIETESGSLQTESYVHSSRSYSQALVIPENTHSSAKKQTSSNMDSPPTWADSFMKQSQAMTKSCESPQPRIPAAKDAETLQSQQTIT